MPTFLFFLTGVLWIVLPIAAIRMVRKDRKRIISLEQHNVTLTHDVQALQKQIRALQVAPPSTVAEAAANSFDRTTETAPVPGSIAEPISETIPEPIPKPAAPPVMAKRSLEAAIDAEFGPVPAVSISVPVAPQAPVPVRPVPASAPLAATAAAPRNPTPEPEKYTTEWVQQTPQWMNAAGGFLGKAKTWLLSGNLVAKLGLLILFIGVSFLLKYVAGQITIPIELRLAAIVLADIALLSWGWHIRKSRPGISLPLQGTALAILMLVTFGAFRLYDLIPAGMAFGLLFVLTVFTCLLAVLQNAVWLAVFGIIGGFAVPLLTATGSGNHIGLFSYYALLNAGVLAIALYRSWRLLNLLSFGFTFVVGTAWGVLKYTPENYLSAQLFLLLFFLFYVAIAVLYATRQAPKLKAYVDATLVFGTPLLATGLQFGLVSQMPFGLAFSALAAGLFYTALALLLWRRGSNIKLLAEAFLALGIVFGTLAIPFALDGRWTSAAWALEGAGIVWVGLRQRQPLAWSFGLLVQAGAWISFLDAVGNLNENAALQGNLWLGFLLLAATAMLMALTFRKQSNSGDEAATNLPLLQGFAFVFLAGATVWTLAGAWTEILLRTDHATRLNLLSISALLLAGALALLARRLDWRAAGAFCIAVQAAAGVALVWHTVTELSLQQSGLFQGTFVSALMLGASLFYSAWFFERQGRTTGQPAWSQGATILLPVVGLYWFGLILPPLSLGTAVPFLLGGAEGDNLAPVYAGYVLLVAFGTFLFVWLARRLAWPVLRWFTVPTWIMLAATSLKMLSTLYVDGAIPAGPTWCALLALWLAGEYLLRIWPRNGWLIDEQLCKILHTLRSGAPWLMIWPFVGQVIGQWLAASEWQIDAAWSRYLPAWAMMLVIALLIRRVQAHENAWPVAPVAPWYRRVLLPLATVWSAGLIALWNVFDNGAMAPLPYIPLLNPLDLSTGFAILLTLAAWRMLRAEVAALLPEWRARLPLLAALLAFAWFNLMLLRTVSNYMGVPYEFEAMFASRFVQAMLSLVWSVSALLLMRRAAQRRQRPMWSIGAALLGVVVVKLFLVDLSNIGGIERIVSFVGVGVLMVVIGYLAPFPPAAATHPEEKEA